MTDTKTKKINYEVSTKELAKLFNLTQRRIEQLTIQKVKNELSEENQKAIFKPIRKTKHFIYDLEESIKAYIQYLQEIITGKQNKLENLKKENEKLDVDIELKNIKLESEKLKLKTEQLKLEELECNMHRSEDVQYLVSDLVLTIRSMLSSLPARLADELVMVETAEQVNQTITEEINTVLTTLSKFKYSKKKYRERVLERNKLEKTNNEDENEDI